MNQSSYTIHNNTTKHNNDVTQYHSSQQLDDLSSQLQNMFTPAVSTSDMIVTTAHNTMNYMKQIKSVANHTLEQTIKLLKVGTLFYTYIQSNHNNKLIKKTLLMKYSSIYKHGSIQLYIINKHHTDNNSNNPTDAVHTITLSSITNIYIGKTTCQNYCHQNQPTTQLYSQHSIDSLCWCIEYNVATNQCVLALESLDSSEMSMWIITLLALINQHGKSLDIVHDGIDRTQQHNNSTSVHTIHNILQDRLQPPTHQSTNDTNQSQQAIQQWMTQKNHELMQSKLLQQQKQAELDQLKLHEKLMKSQQSTVEYNKWLQSAELKLQQQNIQHHKLKQTELMKQNQHKHLRQQQYQHAYHQLEQRITQQNKSKQQQQNKLQQSQSMKLLSDKHKHDTALKKWYTNKRDDIDLLLAKQIANKLLDSIEYDNQVKQQHELLHDQSIDQLQLSITGKHISSNSSSNNNDPSNDLNTTIDTILSTSHITPNLLLDVTKCIQSERLQQKQLEDNWKSVYIPPVMSNNTRHKQKKKKPVTRPVWGYNNNNRPNTAHTLRNNVVTQSVD